MARTSSRFIAPVAAAALFAAAPARSQTPISAPASWIMQKRAGGAITLSPPDLKAGEVYSVTVYDSAPLNGQTPEEYLRKFAGPVGTGAGKLRAPLGIKAENANLTSGIGTYNGPNGAELGVVFFGLSLDGAEVSVERILFSSESLLTNRYKTQNRAILGSLAKRAIVAGQPPIKQPTEAQQEAAPKAEPGYKWTTAPGKGVQNAQIAAIIRHLDFDFEPGLTGPTTHTTDEAFLLLQNGTIYAGLPVPPDEFDALRSRQHEPAKWGKWRQVGGGYQVSWGGAPFQALPGFKVLPAPAGLRLNGYYRAASSRGGSLSIWGVTFGPHGRFRKSTSGSSIIGSPNSPVGVITTTHDENGTFVGGENFSVSSKGKSNPNGNSEGTYTLNGYTLTLRYDNGRIARWPFFFVDPGYEELWFEDGSLGRHDEK